MAKRLLKPQGTQLPAGVNIPDPAALVALQQRLICCLSTGSNMAVQAAAVPSAAIQLFHELMQHSLALPLFDPITKDCELALALQKYGCKLQLGPPDSAACGIIVAPTAESLANCLSALQAYPASWIACYLPSKLNKQTTTVSSTTASSAAYDHSSVLQPA